ncbi:MAG: precorrin-6y C5,15-methyltransferase (decarboxylating) subunit CbiE [Pirellulales bacterium]
MKAATEKISIVGIGDDGLEGLSSAARQVVNDAKLLVGDAGTLALVPDTGVERLVVGNDISAAAERLSTTDGKRVAVLVYGDPLFYGLARYLCDHLGKDRFEVVPHVSSMQLAFARVKESWEEAYLTNLANHPLEVVLDKIRVADRIGLFTTDTRTPADVARALLDRKIDYFSAYVCENLGSPDERVTFGTLADISRQSFAPLNVMILIRRPDAPDRPQDAVGLRLFGNPEEFFLQSKPKQGLLTPAEVRCMALAALDIGPSSVVWDIGAGCGPVSIEAAQIARDGKVFAIEMDAEDYELIHKNCERFGVQNVVPILGKAPEALADLPEADCVFVEGSGREISRIVEAVYDRLRSGGRLVANVGSIENLSDVHKTMSRKAEDVKVWMVNISRGTFQLDRVRFDALNPTFVLGVVKPN